MFLPDFPGIFPALLALASTLKWSASAVVPVLTVVLAGVLLAVSTWPDPTYVVTYIVTVAGGLGVAYGIIMKARVEGFKMMEAAMKGSATETIEELKHENKVRDALALERGERIAALEREREQDHAERRQILELLVAYERNASDREGRQVARDVARTEADGQH